MTPLVQAAATRRVGGPSWAIEIEEMNGTTLMVATARSVDKALEYLDSARSLAEASLNESGAILLRGFKKGPVSGFNDFVAGFGFDLLSYDFGSTPRSQVEQGVYSSTDYPRHQWIPQHNEQSYTLKWPLKIWFYCDIAPEEGGATPIANSREVYRRIDPAIRRRFARKGLMYVRNFGNGLDVPWEQVFRTEERTAVEDYCRGQRIGWEWRGDRELRTWQLCQSEASHPRTGERVWFNQAHLFHISALERDVRESLLSVVDEADLPRNVYYGDGTPIEDEVLGEIRQVYHEVTLSFAWREGDILLLDNMLTSHGRAPFQGRRRILVAMTEPHLFA